MPIRPPAGRRAADSKSLSRLCLIESFYELCSRGSLKEALVSLAVLARKGIRIDTRAFAFLLRQCGAVGSLPYTKWAHLHLKLTARKRPATFLANQVLLAYLKCGSSEDGRKLFDEMRVRNVYSWNTMLAGYAKLGMMEDAGELFERMPERDVVSWNTMVVAFAKNGMCRKAVEFYMQLSGLGIGYNQFTFAGVLIACKKMEEVTLTQQVHGQVLVVGFLSNVVISSSIVDAYAKCGLTSDARNLFDEMPVRDVACWTSMLSGYAKCGDLDSACRLFALMPEKNSVSWTALIAGHVEHGRGLTALELFTKMMEEGLKPDQFTYSSILCACAGMASLRHGKQVHAHLIRTRFAPNVIVSSSLVDMYSKCGNLGASGRVFSLTTNKRNLVLWNTMISAFAQHGHGREAIQLYNEMLRLGINPDDITFVVVLNACCHSGLVKEGRDIFKSMNAHGVAPTQEHYACLVDILGRAGLFDEVVGWLQKMPYEPDARIWKACRVHGNVKPGKKAAQRLLELESQSGAPYVSLSNIYSETGLWDSIGKVRCLMNEGQLSKVAAISWVEVENKVHAFASEDGLHPMKEEIYGILDQLAATRMDDVCAV